MDGSVDIKRIKVEVKEELIDLLQELKESPLDAYSFEDGAPKNVLLQTTLRSFSFYEDCPDDSLEQEPEVVVECPICQFKCNGYSALHDHVAEFVGSNKSTCYVCHEVLPKKVTMTRHLLSHTGVNVKCRICNQIFDRPDYLLKHVKLRHVVTVAEIEARINEVDAVPWEKSTKRRCDFCGIVFATKEALKRHLPKHGQVRITCEVCGMMFKKEWQHTQHMRRHEEDVPCGQCDRMFVSKKLLKFHMKFHTGEREFLCEECGASFKTKHALQGHSRQVHIEAGITCQECGRKFKREAVLKKHRCRVGYKGKR